MLLAQPNLEGDFLPLEIPEADFAHPQLASVATETPTDTFHELDTRPPLLSESPQPSTDPTVTEKRAQKAHIALGAQSPGTAALRNQMDLGEEPALREAVAAQQALEERKFRLGLVQEATRKIDRDLTMQEAEELMSLATVDTTRDPETILEELYGQRVVTSIPAMLDNTKIHKDALNEIPEQYLDTADASAQHIAKNRIAQTVLEDVSAEWERQGIFSTVKNYAKQLVPFWSYANLTGAVENAPTSFSLEFGRTIEEEINYLYSLKPSAFKKELVAAVRKIQEDSPLDAYLFAQGAISYSTNDRAIDNVLGAMDMTVFLMPLKGLRGAATVAKTSGEVAEDAARVISSAPKAIPSANVSVVNQNVPVNLSSNPGMSVVWDGAKGELSIGPKTGQNLVTQTQRGVPAQAETVAERYPDVNPKYLKGMPDEYANDFDKAREYTSAVKTTYDPGMNTEFGRYLVRDIAKETGLKENEVTFLIRDSKLVPAILSRIRTGLSKKIPAEELVERHIRSLGGIVDEVIESVGSLPRGATKDDWLKAVNETLTVSTLQKAYAKTTATKQFTYAPDKKLFDEFFYYAKGKRFSEVTPESKALRGKSGYTVSIDLNKIMDTVTTESPRFKRKVYPASEEGFYTFLKDSGYPRSIFTGPIDSPAAVKSVTDKLVENIPADQGLHAAVEAFLDGSFAPWPKYVFTQDTARAMMDLKKNFSVVEVDPDKVAKVGGVVRQGQPLYVGAEALPRWLGQDPSLLLEHVLWHETAHTVVEKAANDIGLSVVQKENLVNAMAFAKLKQKRLEPGIRGTVPGEFGSNAEPIPYQLKDYKPITGGPREPAVIYTDEPSKGGFIKFDKANGSLTVDREGLSRQYERAPWRNFKVKGVKPLPDADFTKVQDWIDFSVEKAKLKSVLKRNTGEAFADFENRLNQMSVQSLRNSKLQQGAIVRNMMADMNRSGMTDDAVDGMSHSAIDGAADAGVLKRLNDDWMDKDPLDDSLMLRERTPSIFSLESLGQSFSRERTDKILRSLRRNAETLLRIPLNNAAVVRLPEGALQTAIEETKKSLARTYNHVNDAFLDVSFDGPYGITHPEDQLVNTTVVHLRLGKPDAQLFDSPSQAAIYGVDMYGLSPNGFSILQKGNGFYINIAKSVDETLDAVRNVLIDTNNKSEGGFLNAFLGLIRTPEDQLSKLANANRKLATTAAQELHRLMLDASKTISKNISSVERDQLTAIWKMNRDYIDEATGERGYFYNTLDEFEGAFHDKFRQLPTENQTEAYFTYVQMMDMDYILRNLALHRDMSRIGAERIRVFTDVATEGGEVAAAPSKPFAGRLAERIPFDDTSEDFGVWVYDPRTKKGEYHLRSQLTKDLTDEINNKTSKDGFRIVEVVNPLEKPLMEAAQTNEIIHFAVVKNYDNAKFDWGILPYRPGGHVEYGDQFFVKQPRLRRSRASGAMRHIYEGDTSILSAATGAEATKWAKVADTARQLLRANKQDELATYLDKNAPWNLDEFKAFFTDKELPNGTIKPALLHLDDEITWTYTGRNTSDMDHYKGKMERNEGYFNAIRSKYNLFAQSVDKKYLGSRDPDLPRVDEIGTEANPVFKLAKPRLLSPLDTLNKSIANVTRSRHMTDFKTTAIESFIEEFSPVMKTAIAELRRNPVYYFHNPVWDTETTNKTLLAAAQSTRRANLMFIGTESELGGKMFWLQSKLVDTIYSKLGQKASNFVTEKYLPTVKDPFTYARSIAFHTKLGLFNPVQLVLQAQSFVHVAAIAGPRMAASAGYDAILMRLLKLTEDEATIDHFARMSGRADMFKESFLELKKTGLYNVGGEVAWRDDVFEPNLFKGPVGSFLEKGTMFFDEGERFVRLSAWNAAYYAWREANPGKKIDNFTRNEILQRADLMSVNMTRASNAAWQQGLWSVPTQFLAFQARLSEQLLPGFSSRLTTAEKKRAYLTYAAMYGVPVSGGAALGVYPFYEDVRQAALERGVELDNKLIQAAHEGLMSTMLSVISGKDYNVNERYGPGGTTLFKEIVSGDKPAVELLLGASGSIIGDIFSSAEPATNAIMSLFSPEVAPPTMEDFLEVTRNVSTVNNAAKAWYMYNQGRFFTKNGSVVTDNNTGFDAFMTGVFGLTPRDATDTFLMVKSRKEQKEAEASAEKEVIKYYRMAIREYNNDDRQLGDSYLKRAKAWLVSSGINPDQYSSIISKAVKNNETMFNSVREDFWRKAPASEVQDRKEMIQNKNKGY